MSSHVLTPVGFVWKYLRMVLAWVGIVVSSVVGGVSSGQNNEPSEIRSVEDDRRH